MLNWQHSVASFFSVVCISLGVATLIVVNWVSDSSSDKQIIRVGLSNYEIISTINKATLASGSLSDKAFPLGAHYRDAGFVTMVLGAIGVCLCALSLACGIPGLLKPRIVNFRALFAASILGWLSSAIILSGAISYEQKRPAFGLNQGYEWCFGVFVASGLTAGIASVFWGWAAALQQTIQTPLLPTAHSAPKIPKEARGRKFSIARESSASIV